MNEIIGYPFNEHSCALTFLIQKSCSVWVMPALDPSWATRSDVIEHVGTSFFVAADLPTFVIQSGTPTTKNKRPTTPQRLIASV